jgi:hypothetical protein
MRHRVDTKRHCEIRLRRLEGKLRLREDRSPLHVLGLRHPVSRMHPPETTMCRLGLEMRHPENMERHLVFEMRHPVDKMPHSVFIGRRSATTKPQSANTTSHPAS